MSEEHSFVAKSAGHFPLYALLTFGSITFIGIALTIYVYTEIDGFLKRGVVERVETIAASLDTNLIPELYGGEDDLRNPAYMILKDRMQSIHIVNHDSRFVYLMGKRQDDVFFFVDSENPQSDDYSPPGQVFDEASPLLKNVFTDNKAAVEVASDRWGRWVSGLAPITDLRTGDVIAVVGMDIDASSYLLTLFVYSSLPLFATIVLLLIFVLAYRIRKDEEQRLNTRAELLTIASHEIRSPLTGIRWAVESMLAHKEELSPALEKKLSSIYESSLIIINRVGNLLTANSIERKSGKLRMGKVMLRGTIEGIVRMLTLVADQKNVELKIAPAFTPNATIQGDTEKIQTLFANLLSNAVKYAIDGSVIDIGYAETSTMHEIHISNTGQTIPPEDITHLFSEFYRAHNTGEKEGTGLGLFLAKRITDLHKGSIGVTSKEGVTTFTISLPKA